MNIKISPIQRQLIIEGLDELYSQRRNVGNYIASERDASFQDELEDELEAIENLKTYIETS